MPLKPGYSRETFEHNYAQMKREHYPHAQALAASFSEARKSFFDRFPNGALPLWLTPKGGKRTKPVKCEPCERKQNPAATEKKRKPNPVPPSSRALSNDRLQRIEMAENLYTRFTGHDADEVVEVDKPILPDVMLVVGDIDGVLYTTVRDGKTEKYIHKFKKNCRPLFTVSPDGKQIFMLGGSYDFTERGIVDKT
jgi:hypothetical protein